MIVSDIEGEDKKTLLTWDTKVQGAINDYWWLDNNLILLEGRYLKNKGLFLLNPNSQKIRRILIIEAMNCYPSYNRKTNKIAYLDKGYIFVLDLTKMCIKKLIKTDGFGLAWDPNGDRIMYCEKRTNGNEILLYDINENKASILLNDNRYYYAPRWYNDNTFSCIADDLCIKYKLLKNDSAEVIDKITKENYLSKIWSNNGSKYLEILGKGDKSILYYVEVDSQVKETIEQNGEITDIKWREAVSE